MNSRCYWSKIGGIQGRVALSSMRSSPRYTLQAGRPRHLACTATGKGCPTSSVRPERSSEEELPWSPVLHISRDAAGQGPNMQARQPLIDISIISAGCIYTRRFSAHLIWQISLLLLRIEIAACCPEKGLVYETMTNSQT